MAISSKCHRFPEAKNLHMVEITDEREKRMGKALNNLH